MISRRNPIAKLAISVAIVVAMFTVLGAATPIPHSGTAHAVHYAGELPANLRTVAHPDHIKQYSCTYESIGYWVDKPNGSVIDLFPNVYNCSGNNYVDSIQWIYSSGGGIQLQSWWFYTNCGDWISATSGSPNTYLNSSNTSYSAYIGKNVPNSYHFDVDAQYNPGGEWTNCM